MNILKRLWSAVKAEWEREMPIPWYLWAFLALTILGGISAGLEKLLAK